MKAHTPDSRASAPRAADARTALLGAATRLFAEHGYAATPTRAICAAAGANVAAIHYYFGDKAGLYREVLLTPLREMTAQFGRFDDPALPFGAAMRMLLAPFVAPALPGEAQAEALAMRLHLREMLEPTPVFREIVATTIAPVHGALTALLARHCGLRAADDEIHQLAFAMVAMANDYCMSREFMRLLAPGVLDRPNAAQRILDRLVGYCEALLAAEVARRGAQRGRGNRSRPQTYSAVNKPAARSRRGSEAQVAK
ncbi:MAG: CerR family C-terminal domain-containing protein [Burkholderiales bacterium]|jgi:AcrR family transcriptional regulator|nr:CerR family C-terminal domain-containing protein [Burkholderiales bacterium]